MNAERFQEQDVAEDLCTDSDREPREEHADVGVLGETVLLAALVITHLLQIRAIRESRCIVAVAIVPGGVVFGAGSDGRDDGVVRGVDAAFSILPRLPFDHELRERVHG